jgi:hypothetical protein
MRKILAQVIYILNIVIFVSISARALYGCYLFLSGTLLQSERSVVAILILVSIGWLFLILKLRKLKEQGNFTKTLIWGGTAAVIPGILLFIFLLGFAFSGG